MTCTEPPFISRPTEVLSRNGRGDPLLQPLSSRPQEQTLISSQTGLSKTQRDPGVMKWSSVLAETRARSNTCVAGRTAVPSEPPGLDSLPKKNGSATGTPSMWRRCHSSSVNMLGAERPLQLTPGPWISSWIIPTGGDRKRPWLVSPVTGDTPSYLTPCLWSCGLIPSIDHLIIMKKSPSG